MIGIGPEGNPGAAPEPVVAETTTLNPEQIGELLSLYRNLILGHDRAIHGEDLMGNRTISDSPEARQEARRGFSGMIFTSETVFGIIGISDRARQTKDEAKLGEFERREQEIAA